jgi:hypothetical protein
MHFAAGKAGGAGKKKSRGGKKCKGVKRNGVKQRYEKLR